MLDIAIECSLLRPSSIDHWTVLLDARYVEFLCGRSFVPKSVAMLHSAKLSGDSLLPIDLILIPDFHDECCADAHFISCARHPKKTTSIDVVSFPVVGPAQRLSRRRSPFETSLPPSNALFDLARTNQEEIRGLHEKGKDLQQKIKGLEREIAAHKREIKFRDDTIGEKEKKIYELKKKNQEVGDALICAID